MHEDIKDGKGPIENLHIADISKPKLGKSQALVKIKAFGLNRMDLLQREGQYPVPPGASKILGVEFSGTIAELSAEGGGKEGFKEGDEVFGLAYGGAYAEYIAVSTHMLVRKPKELTWEQCAGIPEVSYSHRILNMLARRGISAANKDFVDMDYCDSSHVSRRSICRRQDHPLARSRFLSLDSRYPIVPRRQGVRRLRNRTSRCQMRLCRQRTRCNCRL